MSFNLKKVNNFLHLLLTTTPLQAISLILTATDEQLIAISEIAFNLLQLPLKGKEKENIEKRHKILKKIANKNITAKNKQLLIQRHRKIILNLFLFFKQKLLNLLK